jgi:predicted fused transcriptional regulator/phosphomethylpyrimidine kinase
VGRREEEADVKERLELAVQILLEGISPALLPRAGANLGYALPGARVPGDVAAIMGGIVERGGKVLPPDATAFGADAGVARVILTAMRTDPEIRSAAVIRFSPKILGVAGDLLLETCGFDRAKEPPGVSTMDWGVASCCRDGVPDAIFDRGAQGLEGLIRILGEEPVAVAKKILQISSGLEG